MTTPRCALCGRPEDEATPSFSTYLHGVDSRCPECGKPQGADLVDRAEVEGELADLRAEVTALRRAADEVLSWSLNDTTALWLSNPPQNAALFHAQRVLRAALDTRHLSTHGDK